jgi:hypothetical protein
VTCVDAPKSSNQVDIGVLVDVKSESVGTDEMVGVEPDSASNT